MQNKSKIIAPDQALPGRKQAMPVTELHFVNQTDLRAAPTTEQQQVVLGLGCFWGAERVFWQLEGVISTSVGYSGGYTPNPTYQEVCTGETGHAEVVRVIYDPNVMSLQQLLAIFWEKHDPTLGMRQGNDIGSQYRSTIYVSNQADLEQAQQSLQHYQAALSAHHTGAITTEIALLGPYYLAETYHQQYLAKNPQGYCGIGGTGVYFPPQLQD